MQKTITQSDQEQTIDLTFFYLETKINEYWLNKGFPLMLRVRDVTDDVVSIAKGSTRPGALFIRSARILYRIDSHGLPWAKIRRAFKELIPNIKIVE